MIPKRTPAEELAFWELVAEYGSTPFDCRLIKLRAQKYEVTIPPLPGAVVIPPLPPVVIIPELP